LARADAGYIARMEAFAALIDWLYFAHSPGAKTAILAGYLRRAPDPDRGIAVGILAGTLSTPLFKRALVRDLVAERMDPALLAASSDYVGDFCETAAHVWPRSPGAALLNRIPPLHEVIQEFEVRDKAGVQDYLTLLLDNMTPTERWVLLKLGLRSLRAVMQPRAVKQALADFGGVDAGEIEGVWHAAQPPYIALFAWLEGRAGKPDCGNAATFHPLMLAHEIDDAVAETITPDAFLAEWKYDGIRVQLVSAPGAKALFSRAGDDISASFPEVMERVDFEAVLDGELMVEDGGKIAGFGHLQQRLARKSPDLKNAAKYPAHLILYDALSLNGRDLRALQLAERKACLARWFDEVRPAGMELAQPLAFRDPRGLEALRAGPVPPHIEGLMLKRLDGAYVAGRPRGLWYKWKRDPKAVDAVLMYAQRGAGKRSSFLGYTFGLWRNGALLPIGKADFGGAEDELAELGKWVRDHAAERFGPVVEVEKALVMEVAFDAVHRSARHKSGVTLRFPRIRRIRWDKPASEADELDCLAKWL
jgi:DNA ligase 1